MEALRGAALIAGTSTAFAVGMGMALFALVSLTAG